MDAKQHLRATAGVAFVTVATPPPAANANTAPGFDAAAPARSDEAGTACEPDEAIGSSPPDLPESAPTAVSTVRRPEGENDG